MQGYLEHLHLRDFLYHKNLTLPLVLPLFPVLFPCLLFFQYYFKQSLKFYISNFTA